MAKRHSSAVENIISQFEEVRYDAFVYQMPVTMELYKIEEESFY